MLLTVLLFLLGLLLLIGGGEALVRGAGALARSAGVPAVVVGLTVVAFGTSAPELIVAVTGALRGAEGVSFGNVVGANIVNIAFIIGATALIMPLTVNSIVVTREIPMAGLAMLATVVLSFDALFGSGPDRLTRGDGFLLLLLFGVFLYYTVRAMRRRKGRPGRPGRRRIRLADAGAIAGHPDWYGHRRVCRPGAGRQLAG